VFDVPADGGCTTVVPGTHRLPGGPRETLACRFAGAAHDFGLAAAGAAAQGEAAPVRDVWTCVWRYPGLVPGAWMENSELFWAEGLGFEKSNRTAGAGGAHAEPAPPRGPGRRHDALRQRGLAHLPFLFFI
jgi:hypothetical protein